MHGALYCIPFSVMQLLHVHNSCMTQTGMQLFCHPKYSILYGALMIFVVGSGQE